MGANRCGAGLPFANRKACADQRSSTIRNPLGKANGSMTHTYVIYLHFEALSDTDAEILAPQHLAMVCRWRNAIDKITPRLKVCFTSINGTALRELAVKP